MSNIIYEIENVKKELPDIIKNFRQCRDNMAYDSVKQILPNINNIYMKFISSVSELAQKGIDLPQDVILLQLQNMIEGFEYKDTVKLADTLEYEIMDTLNIFEEILDNLNE